MISTAAFRGLAFAAWCVAPAFAADVPKLAAIPVETPIIAELFSKPQAFIGRHVQVYGLVIQSQDSGTRFSLQDVSQMPLAVIAPAGTHVAPGSQLMVHGVVRREAGQIVLSGEAVAPVQVLAGGGCC